MNNLNTLVYHISENSEVYPPIVHIPDVNAVYQQILAVNNGKYPYVYLLPIYNGHLSSWDEEKAWIINNFADIPIMLEVFSSTGGATAFQLFTDDILEIMAVVPVRWVRFFEVVSWYAWHNVSFPQDYVINMLNFCKQRGLKVFWSEWSVWYVNQNITLIKTLIHGFEDIVTFGFGTNSGDLEPEEGFAWLKNLRFEHWGGSVQAWYWDTHHNASWSGYEYPLGLNDLLNMPVSWMIMHANICRDLGGELIQFEPYWYFFGYSDGKARDNLKILHNYLNSANASMGTSTTILQTLIGEWVNAPSKDDIYWIDGCAFIDREATPAIMDFMKSPKKYAICCYSLSNVTPSSNVSLKVESIAVNVFVKVSGTTFQQALLDRESMRTEVERIMYMYSEVGPLWCPRPGPNGASHQRKIQIRDLKDSSIPQILNQGETSIFAWVTIQVKCRIFLKLP